MLPGEEDPALGPLAVEEDRPELAWQQESEGARRPLVRLPVDRGGIDDDIVVEDFGVEARDAAADGLDPRRGRKRTEPLGVRPPAIGAEQRAGRPASAAEEGPTRSEWAGPVWMLASALGAAGPRSTLR